MISANTVIAIASCAAVLVAWFQLGRIRKQFKLNTLMAVLEIEAQLLSCKEKLDSISAELRKLNIENSEQAKQFSEVYSDHLDSTLENYLNTFDRLCFCIIKNYFAERDWKTEYRNMLHRTVEMNPDEFRAATPYRNMLDLDDKWQRE